MNDLPGHLEIKSCLNRFIQTKNLPGTFLFSGPKGVGKNQLALAFANELLQTEGGIQKLDSGNHPDLRLYYPEGKSRIHTMQSIHHFIQEVELPPFESERKVLILYDADCMLGATANALLKTLEEPLHSSIIILTTSHFNEILPTITSRCFPIVFSPISDAELISYLLSTYSLEEEEARRIALFSQGILSKAELLAKRGEDHISHLVPRAAYFAIQREYIQFSKVLATIESLEEGKEGSMLDRREEILHLLFCWYRDLHLLKIGGDPRYLFYKERLEDLRTCLEYPFPTLEEIQKKIYKVQEAQKYNIRLSHCLQALLLYTQTT